MYRKNTSAQTDERIATDGPLYTGLVEWIYDKRSNGLGVSRKLIMAKAKYFHERECDGSEKSLFVASNGWVNNFMRHNGFSLRRKTTTAQQDPERLIDKLILYILHARRLSTKYKYLPSSIIAMDETSVWNDKVSNTRIDKQGAKSV